ncbi:MAG: enoyl-CoA hydratase/isomerase family protein [Gammaproteobacteria bacterium]
MSAPALLVDRRDGCLRVTLNRPEKRNALSRALLAEIRSTFLDAADDPELRIAVVSGAGEKSFAAGGDLADLAKVRTAADTRAMSADARAAMDAIRRFPLPVLAALNGDALGGGAELAVACDFRLAARHARIGFLQAKLNISSAWGGGGDLMDLVGAKRALRLLCTAEVLAPDEALRLGLYDAVADGSLEDAVETFVAPYLERSPRVLRAYKAMAIAAHDRAGRDEFVDTETAVFVDTWTHPDHWAIADHVLDKSKREKSS